MWSSNSTPRYVPRRNENICPQKHIQSSQAVCPSGALFQDPRGHQNLRMLKSLVWREGWSQPSVSSGYVCTHFRSSIIDPKGNQPWIFIGRTAAEAEAPVLWPLDAKSGLMGKGLDARKDWGQKEKGAAEDEMVRQHRPLSGHESGQTAGDGERQESLQSTESQRVRHNLATEQQLFIKAKGRRQTKCPSTDEWKINIPLQWNIIAIERNEALIHTIIRMYLENYAKWKKSVTKGHIFIPWSHSYEMSRIGKSTETEHSCMVGQRPWGRDMESENTKNQWTKINK